MKTWIVLILLVLSVTFCWLAACDTADFGPDGSETAEGAKGGFEVLSQNTEHLRIALQIQEPVFDQRSAQGMVFDTVRFGNHGNDGEVGAPSLPAFGQIFAIPQGARVEVEVNEGAVTTIENVFLWPHQPPASDAVGDPEPEFAFDEKAYQVDDFLPRALVSLEDEKIMRGLRINHLRVCPVRYNSARQELQIIREITVTLNFIGGRDRFFADDALRTEPFERMFRTFVTNHESIRPYSPPMQNGFKSKGAGAQFLIIAAPEFAEAANDLMQWKQMMGMETEVVTTLQTGAVYSEIRDFISKAYFDRAVAPAYVLFIGDAEFIPTGQGTFHTSHFSRTGTDLYYACVDGDDIFPDMAIGRLSVDTADQAKKRVADIVKYQKDPTTNEAYYKTSFHLGYFQDSDKNNMADRRFALTSEEMYQWFSQVLTGSEIVPERCYYADPNVTPQKWNRGSYYFFTDWWTLPKDQIPSELLRASGFGWDCTAADVKKRINQGAFFVTHRDHGAINGWGEPAFANTDVWDLTNNDRLPVLFSINCQTGWFDNETDSVVNFTAPGSLSFSEVWERNALGGAVGILAATRVSYSGYNDRLVWGWMDAMWPGYVSDFDGGLPFESQMPLGDVLNYGKLYMTLIYGRSSTRKIEMEEFHWFGDPTMKMWIGTPREFSPEYPHTVKFGTESIVVESDVDGAMVVLGKDGVAFDKKVISNGQAVFVITNPPEIHTEYEIVLTHEGYRPFIDTVAYVECDSATDCDDGLFCNGAELCAVGFCVEADEPPCADDQTCDEQAQSCIIPKAGGDDDDDEGGCGC